jgi:hypothetical protein
VEYSWDFDQTEEYAYDKEFSADSANRSFTFHTPGIHTVMLWARNVGVTARWMRGTTMTINVTAPAAPGWQLSTLGELGGSSSSPLGGYHANIAGQLASLYSLYDNSISAYRTQFKLGDNAPVDVVADETSPGVQAKALGMVDGLPVALLSDGTLWTADNAAGSSWHNSGSVPDSNFNGARILNAGGKPGLLYAVTGYKVDPPQTWDDLEVNLYYTVADNTLPSGWSTPQMLAEDITLGGRFDAALVNLKPFVVCSVDGVGTVSIAAEDSQGTSWGPQALLSSEPGKLVIIETNPPLVLLSRWEPGGTRLVLYGTDSSLSSWTELEKFGYGISDFMGGHFEGRALVAYRDGDVLTALLATDTGNTQFSPAQIVQESSSILDCVQLGEEPVLVNEGVDKKLYLARYGH